jgi:hypothetical protein
MMNHPPIFFLNALRHLRRAFMCCSLVAFAIVASAQAPQLPHGFHLLEDAPDPCIVKADLDGDKKADVFCAAKRDNETDARLLAILKDGKSIITSGTLSMCCGSIAVRGNVVDVHSQGMRGFSYYKFRWDAAAKDFRLIGYDTESFGTATGDGSGKSSINLLTGSYEAAFSVWNEKREQLIALPKIKRKVSVSRKFYLKGFNEDADQWLTDLNARYLPKEVR